MALTEAQKEAKRRYRERHPERVKAQSKKHSRKYYAKNREEIKLRVKLRKYGLTRDEHVALEERAAGVCEACSRPFGADKMTSPNIDHCHNTGQVRGLLCGACNIALGTVQDSPDRLRALLAYVSDR